MAVRPARLITAIIAMVAVASLWRAVVVEREKQRILAAYAQAQALASQLDSERAQLTVQLADRQAQLEMESAERAKLNDELQRVQGELANTAGELDSLQGQYAQLEGAHIGLTSQFNEVTAEKEELEAKFASLHQLKLAIRSVKRQMRLDRWEARRLRIIALQEADQDTTVAGNRGYVVRNGAPTLGVSSSLRVHVLQPEAP
jgi:chromosome segregation ATPase